MKKLKVLGILLVILLACTTAAFPAAISSNGTGGGNASAGSSWTGGVAPAEGDTVTVLNGDTITLDAAATVWGADTTTAACQINSGGILQYLYTAGVNGVLTAKGDVKVAGTFNIGTVANPIPNTDTFTLKLNYSASLSDGEFGLIIQAGGAFVCQGSDPWANGLTDPDRCLLAADAAVNATALTVDGAIDWNANDYIVIAPTGTLYNQYEIGQVDSCSGTTLNVKSFAGAGGGLAFAHTGTNADVRAEIINLTRNIVIMNYDGVIGTPGSVAYVVFETTATVDVDWTEFRYLGENATDKYGVSIKTTSGSSALTRCSFHHFEDGGVDITATTTINNFTVQDCVGYLISNSTARGGIKVGALTNGSWTLDNIWIIGSGVNYAFYTQSLVGTISYIRAAGIGGVGMYLTPNTWATGGTASYLAVHSCNGRGITIYNISNSTLSNITSWHNTSYGISIQVSYRININTIDLYGNTTGNIIFESAASSHIYFSGLRSSGTSTQATTNGVMWSLTGGLAAENIYFYAPSFSYTSGVRVAHTYDVYGANGAAFFKMNNPAFGGSTAAIGFGTGTLPYSAMECFQYDQTADDHRTYVYLGTGTTNGIIQTDATYYATAAPSQKMTPASATIKIESGVVKVPVASGNNPTITVKFRKSNAYNGNQPRLRVKRNDVLGITADTTLATSTASNDADIPPGTFSTLSGQPGAVSADGVLEFVVDCDGTAGYANACDWNVTGAKTQADNLDAYWSYGYPFDGLLSASSGGRGGGMAPRPWR